jgi:hypothetical protein
MLIEMLASLHIVFVLPRSDSSVFCGAGGGTGHGSYAQDWSENAASSHSKPGSLSNATPARMVGKEPVMLAIRLKLALVRRKRAIAADRCHYQRSD